MFRLFWATAFALLLSASAHAQAPAGAKPAAVGANKNLPSPASKPHAPPGAPRPQDDLYRQSSAAARLAEPRPSGVDLPPSQPLGRQNENEADNLRRNYEDRRVRCAHSIKQMREASADQRGRREGRARRDCDNVSFDD